MIFMVLLQILQTAQALRGVWRFSSPAEIQILTVNIRPAMLTYTVKLGLS